MSAGLQLYIYPEEDRQVGGNIGGLYNVSYLHLCLIYIYIYIYNLHERRLSSNNGTLNFRPDAFRLLASLGVFALCLVFKLSVTSR